MIILQKAQNAYEREGAVLLQVWTKGLSNYGNAQSLFFKQLLKIFSQESFQA